MSAKALLSIICVMTFANEIGYCGSLSKNFYHILPESGNSLPVLDIKEMPPNEYDPKEADLNADRLREKLGLEYDPNFMSPTEPEPHFVKGSSKSPRMGSPKRPTGRMPSVFRKLDFTQPNGRPVMRMNRRQRRKLQVWLWQATSCTVIYKWKNLGHRFWPPWIKEGVCDESHSCSLPAGMKCQPSDSITITVLRWHCQGFNSNKMKYCTWIKVQYPIVSQCKCKC